MNIFDYIPQIANHPLFKNVDKNIVSNEEYMKDKNILASSNKIYLVICKK